MREGWEAPTEREQSAGLGVFGAVLGASGQYRFWFVPRENLSQAGLFDRVSGLLLREAHPAVMVRALYLYPPGHLSDEWPLGASESEVFMLLLGFQPGTRSADESVLESALNGEYERLGRMLIEQLADITRPHHPTLGG